MHLREGPHPRGRIAGVVFIVNLFIASLACANHGPGTSGGGSSTASGETLKPGSYDIDLRIDYTQFEDISRAEAERRAVKSEGFDALKNATVTTLSMGYGVLENLQVGASIGYYFGNDFIDAEADGLGGAESSTADPEGLTDLSLNAKFRFLQGAPGNMAVIGGIILPTGRDDVRLSNGELLEPSSQPGTGAVSFQLGLAYSRFLTSQITIDSSAIYTLRTEHDEFKVGDRLDLGAALAYRLTPSFKTIPNWSAFGEVTAVWIGKDQDHGDDNPNSGGWTVYLTPGLRVRLSENLAITVAPSVPVLQELNGDQIESRFKVSATLSYSH